MFTGYLGIPQDGIEPLPKQCPMVKDSKSPHYFFNDYRIAIAYHHNKKDQTSGIGIMTFAPNGLLWCKTGRYAFDFNEIGGIYHGLDEALVEADKSKARNITVILNNAKIVEMLNSSQPFEDPTYMQLHASIKDKLAKYNSFQALYRKSLPDTVQSRLNEQAKLAARPPLFDGHNKHWLNAPDTIYGNIVSTDEEEELWAKKMANLLLDFTLNYMNEYKKDYGKEGLDKLNKKINSGKAKGLPPLKKNLDKQVKLVKAKEFKPIKKKVLCHHCQNEMDFEECLLEKPTGNLKYHYRCKECLATKVLNDQGRTLLYGKYPPEIKKPPIQ